MSRTTRLGLAIAVTLLYVLSACTSRPSATPTPDPVETEAVETEPAATEPEETQEPESTEPTTPSEPPVSGGDGTEFTPTALLERIPPEIVEFCEPAEGTDAFLQVHCELPEGSGADIVNFFVIADAEEVQTQYEAFIISQGVTETNVGSCPDDVPAEVPYDLAGQEAGRLACSVTDDGRAAMTWTDDRLNVIVRAYRGDGDIEALHEWWMGPESGPVQ